MRRKVTFLKIAPATVAAKDTRPVFATMPLRKNVPTPCNPEWKAATCPVCGQACWLQTGNAELVRQIYPNAKFVCSDCAWTGKAAANQRKNTFLCRFIGAAFVGQFSTMAYRLAKSRRLLEKNFLILPFFTTGRKSSSRFFPRNCMQSTIA